MLPAVPLGLQGLLDNRIHARIGAAFFRWPDKAAGGELTGEQFVEHQAERKNVAAGVGGFRLQLLRRHVVQRADDLPLLGERLREVGFLQQTTLLREPEVEQLDPLLRNEYVARFQIPMSYALLMCRIQRVENLARVVDGLFERLIAAGIPLQSPPRDAQWGERFFHVTDPDGHEISFAWPLKPRLR